MKAETWRPPPGPGRPQPAVVQTDRLGPGSRDTAAVLSWTRFPTIVLRWSDYSHKSTRLRPDMVQTGGR